VPGEEVDERLHNWNLEVEQRDAHHIGQKEPNMDGRIEEQMMDLSDTDHTGHGEAVYKVLQGVVLEEANGNDYRVRLESCYKKKPGVHLALHLGADIAHSVPGGQFGDTAGQ
jgi:hypothetical protein